MGQWTLFWQGFSYFFCQASNSGHSSSWSSMWVPCTRLPNKGRRAGITNACHGSKLFKLVLGDLLTCVVSFFVFSCWDFLNTAYNTCLLWFGVVLPNVFSMHWTKAISYKLHVFSCSSVTLLPFSSKCSISVALFLICGGDECWTPLFNQCGSSLSIISCRHLNFWVHFRIGGIFLKFVDYLDKFQENYYL